VPLLERLGGIESVDPLLDLYVDKIIYDKELKQFFDNQNSKKVSYSNHIQKKFRTAFKQHFTELINGQPYTKSAQLK
jgi:hypothetical protein